MNKVIEIGRLTRDPEVRYGGTNNTAVASISIAVDRKFKRDGDQTADFFNCTAFGKTAEFLEKYFHKGMRIALSGHLQNDNYTDKDGNNRTATKIIIEECEFCESKNANSGSQNNNSNDSKTDDGFVNVKEGIEDELPF